MVKHLLGYEIAAYAKAKGILAPIVERNRCWMLDYADEDLLFHMDALPCVPEDQQTIREIWSRGVPNVLAELSVAITDKRRDNYEQICRDWPCSNPRGMGRWFEGKARPAADARLVHLVAKRAYASIEKVPAYEWKTPLQRSIQLMKRHRDVMFAGEPEFAPISMIITVLAGQAYQGELSLHAAIKGILDRLPQFVLPASPRIPNPVNPGEDFAERWAEDARYEANFWNWYDAIKADVDNLPRWLRDQRLASDVRKAFAVNLTAEQVKWLNPPTTVPAEAKAAPLVHIASAPKPWQHGD